MNRILTILNILLLVTVMVLGVMVIKSDRTIIVENSDIGGSTSASWNVGGNFSVTGNSTLTGNLTVGGEILINDRYVQWNTLTMEAGSDQECWINSTGATTTIEDVWIRLGAGTNASSTYDVYVLATTTIPNSLDFTAITEAINGSNTIAINHTIATSTTATTTRATDLFTTGKAILIGPSKGLCLYMQPGWQEVCTGAACETSTSTVRGFNPVVDFKYHR